MKLLDEELQVAGQRLLVQMTATAVSLVTTGWV